MRRHLRQDQRGAAIVEAALVLPAVVLLLFGMLEMGLYFKHSLTVSEATKDAAHTGAMYAADAGADYYILHALLHASLNGIVQEVVVYDAANVDATNSSAQGAPANCLASGTGVPVGYTDGKGVLHTTGAIGSCNVYLVPCGSSRSPFSPARRHGHGPSVPARRSTPAALLPSTACGATLPGAGGHRRARPPCCPSSWSSSPV